MEVTHLCYGNPDCYAGCKYQRRPAGKRGFIQSIIAFLKAW